MDEGVGDLRYLVDVVLLNVAPGHEAGVGEDGALLEGGEEYGGQVGADTVVDVVVDVVGEVVLVGGTDQAVYVKY